MLRSTSTRETPHENQYRYPDWFRDAKLGFWAHWGPQSVPMLGDWYARHMYRQGHKQYQDHLERYGHPTKSGWKDVIPLWTAERWDPARLMALYKKAGARYFVSMGVHHDNFDLWDSRFHRWNAVEMGPHRDVVGEWQKAAKAAGLPFGVSEHLGSKNGNLLINIVQRPDGSLDPEVEEMLGRMADWIAVNGEAIYGTRPWTTFGEGPVRAEGGAFKEDARFTAEYVRFTTRGDTLYAFVLGWPAKPLTVRALGTGAGRVTAVRLLGHDGALQWRQEPEGLTISPPAKRPCDYAFAFAINGVLPSDPRPK